MKSRENLDALENPTFYIRTDWSLKVLLVLLILVIVNCAIYGIHGHWGMSKRDYGIIDNDVSLKRKDTGPSNYGNSSKLAIEPGIPLCDWPPPLYPNSTKSESGDMETLKKIQQWAERHREEAVVYLNEGGLLGMYRDGALVSGDSDIDVVYGFLKHSHSITADKNSLFKLKGPSKISFNHLREWGDHWNGFVNIFKEDVTDDTVRQLQGQMCVPPRSSPLQTHRYTRLELDFDYGPHWFIKMPWKGQQPSQFKLWVDPKNNWHKQWAGCIEVIRNIDSDKNSIVSHEEIDMYVEKDGIDMTEYEKQISAREKCRAAAMLNFILEMNKSPLSIDDSDNQHLHGNNTVFHFPQCNHNATLYGPL